MRYTSLKNCDTAPIPTMSIEFISQRVSSYLCEFLKSPSSYISFAFDDTIIYDGYWKWKNVNRDV